jgi:hypothetical protein
MIEYIHVQLAIWGKWTARQAAKDVGYPSVSPMFNQVQHGGAYESRPPAGVTVGDINEIQDTDDAVSRLSESDKSLVNAYYVRQLPVVRIARDMGLHRQRVYERLTILQQRVLGHLLDVSAGL